MCGVNCEWTELARHGAALCLTALCIRLMDDVVDGHTDRPAEAAAYSLLAFTFAAGLQPTVALSFFVAAYVVGMLGDGTSRLPTGLAPRYEAVLVWTAGGIIVGWAAVVAATLCMLAVQIADDLRDIDDDRRSEASNLAVQWGRVEASLAGICALIGAAWINPLLPVVATAAIVPAELIAEKAFVTAARRTEGAAP